jgi:sortase A
MTARQKRGCALIAAGLVLVLCAVGMQLMEQKQDELAGENAKILLRQLQLDRVTVDLKDDPLQEQEQVSTADPTDMPVKQYLGYDLIGTIRLPALGIELPVLNTWSDALLNVAPCRYAGSLTKENMILMGHNYKNHFYPMLRAQIGMEVEFEDVYGQIYHYRIAEIVTLRASDGELLASDYPLTLFTCTVGGQNRFVVRCEKE